MPRPNTVDPAAITKLADDIEALRKTFSAATTTIGTTTINAGAFAEATQLATRVSTAARDLSTSAANIDKALTTIVTNLKANATTYGGAEVANTTSSQQLDTLITQLKKDLPGFTSGDRG